MSMREIVAAKINGTITNIPATIRKAIEDSKPIEWLDRDHMSLMAAFDLGKKWENLAKGPTFFRIDSDGKAHPPEEGEVDVGELQTESP